MRLILGFPTLKADRRVKRLRDRKPRQRHSLFPDSPHYKDLANAKMILAYGINGRRVLIEGRNVRESLEISLTLKSGERRDQASRSLIPPLLPLPGLSSRSPRCGSHNCRWSFQVSEIPIISLCSLRLDPGSNSSFWLSNSRLPLP